MSRFSIITICLNEAENIRRTCESIVSQSFGDYEWIVVDGQSTDGTLEILDQFRERISCLVSEPDSGIYHAMNKGIALASGDYLLFLNAGDYLADQQVLATVAAAGEEDILFGDLLCIEGEGREFTSVFPDRLSRYFLLKRMMPHQASFFRRRLFQTYGGFDQSYRIAGDYELFARFLYRHQVSYRHVPKVLAVFMTDGISSQLAQRERRKLENHRVRKTHFPWLAYGWKGLKMEWKLRFGRNG
jgi:glycosyltransferase involved in cell wall biosynthesis